MAGNKLELRSWRVPWLAKGDGTQQADVEFGASFLTAAIVFLTLLIATPAHAQINLQFGGSEADFKNRLARDGYTDIETQKIGLSNSRFHACKDGIRFSIRFEWTGNVTRRNIGRCQEPLTEQQVRALLREQGFRRITLEDRAGKYLAIACAGSERRRVEVSYYGEIGRQRRVGDCRTRLTPEDIASTLEENGLTRISFTNRQPPRYVAEACRNRSRIELIINVEGQVLREREIGRCRPQIDPGQVERLLTEAGYTDVTILDGELPRIIAEGCADRRLTRITVNRWGEITDREEIGRCRAELTTADIEESMRENGFTNVSVTQNRRRFVSRGCREARLVEFILTRSGELIDRKPVGECKSPRMHDLAEELSKQGLKGARFMVEGCRDDRRVRVTYDQFANRLSEERLGVCDD